MQTPKNLDELHQFASEPRPAAIAALEACPGDILILGAGGKMGLHVSLMAKRCLAAIGSQSTVTAVSRWGDPAAREEFESRGIQTLACDLSANDDLAKLPDAPNVFFLAGVKFGTADNPELLRKMNIEMPQKVAARFNASKIVALSTGCVYPFTSPESGGSSESDPADPPGDYAQSCFGREQAFTDSGVSCSLIRLNYSVDLRYGVLVDIAQRVRAGLPVDASTGFANVIWQGDAVAHIIASLGKAESPPFVLNVTGRQTLRVRELATQFDEDAKVIGKEAPTAWLSDASLSHQLFGEPEVTENELIQHVHQWLAQGGETLDKPTHFENRDGEF